MEDQRTPGLLAIRDETDDEATASDAYCASLNSVIVVLIVCCVIVAFSPVAKNGFVNWDDDINFIDNTRFRGVATSNLAWAWTTYHLGVYQPVGWTLFGVEYSLWGMSPTGYHIASVVLHCLNALLVYRITLWITRNAVQPRQPDTSPYILLASATATLWFAVHPMRVEVVAWTSCQPYLPCTFFALLSVLAYLKATEAADLGRSLWLCASFLSFVASALCKAPSVCLPVILVILDRCVFRSTGPPRKAGARRALRPWIEKLPFFAFGAVVSLIAVRARAHGTVAEAKPYEFSLRVAQSFYGLGFYVVKSVVPLDLSAYYPFPDRLILDASMFCILSAGIIVAIGASINERRFWLGISAAILAYATALLPTLGLIRTGPTVTADRYSYIPCLILSVACGPLIARFLIDLNKNKIALTGLACSVLLLMASSREQCKVWRDSPTLWAHASSCVTEPIPLVHHLWGLGLLDQNAMREGIARLEEARVAQRHRIDTRKETDTYGGLSQLGAIHDSIALAMRDLGNIEAAFANSQDAISLQTKAYIHDKRVTKYRVRLIYHYMNRWRLEQFARRGDIALPYIRRANALATELVREHGDVESFVDLANVVSARLQAVEN